MEVYKRLSFKTMRSLTAENYFSTFFLLSLLFNTKQIPSQKELELKDAIRTKNIP